MSVTKRATSIQNPFVRIAGVHRTAAEVLRTASLREGFPVRTFPTAVKPLYDYAQIDLTLSTTTPSDAASVAVPNRGLSYAGFGPEQRAWFLAWLDDPSASAPPAFQQLYLANVEASLFEKKLATAALENLLVLNSTPVWQEHMGLSRTILLGLWLQQDGERLGAWLASGNVHPDLLGLAIGHLSLLREELSADAVGTLLVQWRLTRSIPSTELLALRLGSLTETLGAGPLPFLLAQFDDEAKEPKPWRCQHRDLRISLPQPDLRQTLEPLLRDLVDIEDVESPTTRRKVTEDETDQDQEGLEDAPWSLVLEFAESRSEYFPYALTLAKQRPDFAQLMDEDRKLVYRIVFRKREMRNFWRLWDYVSNWSGTHVYVNGRQIEKYNVWPYSQHLR